MRQGAREELQPFADRLRAAVDRFGGVSALQRATGLSRSTLDRWLNSQADASAHDLAKVARALSVTTDYLLSGVIAPGNETSTPDMGHDIVTIPRFSVEVSAGPGSQAIDFGELEPMPFPKAFFQRLGVNPRTCHVIQGRGDSMAPTIVDGGLIIVDASVRRFIGSGIYVFSLGEDVRLKRLEKRSDTGFSIISDNAALYPREELTTQQLYDMKFTIHGRVVWTEKVL